VPTFWQSQCCFTLLHWSSRVGFNYMSKSLVNTKGYLSLAWFTIVFCISKFRRERIFHGKKILLTDHMSRTDTLCINIRTLKDGNLFWYIIYISITLIIFNINNLIVSLKFSKFKKSIIKFILKFVINIYFKINLLQRVLLFMYIYVCVLVIKLFILYLQ